jgi:HAD superfamily hydrolase (TIGR01509 family)
MSRAALLLDCDQTALATGLCWELAEHRTAEKFDVLWTADLHAQLSGASVVETAAIIAEAAGRPGEADAAYELMLATFDGVIDHRGVQAMPGALDLARFYREQGVPVAIVSNSPRRQVVAALNAAGLRPWVDVVVCAEPSSLLPKPAPDLYLRACDLLDADPALSVGIEDTATGLAALRAAGIVALAAPWALSTEGADHHLRELCPLAVRDLFPNATALR